jgi:hypothetical protein
MRPNRKHRSTPKGEAERSLRNTTALMQELEACDKPDQKELFIRRLNDFLRSARTVTTFLEKEVGRANALKDWTVREVTALRTADSRFDHFMGLRAISEHDCIVEPQRSEFAMEIAAGLHMTGSIDAELRNRAGKLLARVSQAAPPGTGNHSHVTQKAVFVKYFLADWRGEDICVFCKGVIIALQGLVSRAYQLYP